MEKYSSKATDQLNAYHADPSLALILVCKQYRMYVIIDITKKV